MPPTPDLRLFWWAMHWSNRYIGVKHDETAEPSLEGANCWGLVCLIYRGELGIVLPSYAGRFASLDEVREVEALFAQERQSKSWELAADCLAFDVVLFRTGLHRRHVGVVVRPGLMLHVATDHPARIESYHAPHWQSRLIGLFRHVQTPRKTALRAVA